MTRLTLHLQGNFYPEWLKASMARLAGHVGYIVAIDPPVGVNYFPYQKTIGRAWIGGDEIEQSYIDQGAAGADALYARMLPYYDAARYVEAWVPVNEPVVENAEARKWLVEFFVRYCELAHRDGVKIGGPCDGVGRLGTDSYLAIRLGNPDWRVMVRAVTSEMLPLYESVDYACSHNYGRRYDAEWTGWEDWTLRMAYVIAAVKEFGVEVPVWLSTEGGLDIGGGMGDGWLGAGGPTPVKYLSQLAEVDRRLPLQVEAYALFTGLHTDRRWAAYDGMDWFWINYMEPYIMATDGVNIGESIGQLAQSYILPLNPAAALEKAAAARGYLPASHEFDVTIDGVAYRAQAFRSPTERDQQYIAYCVVGNWSNVMWFKRAN